jgi:hypothetical protein
VAPLALGACEEDSKVSAFLSLRLLDMARVKNTKIGQIYVHKRLLEPEALSWSTTAWLEKENDASRAGREDVVLEQRLSSRDEERRKPFAERRAFLHVPHTKQQQQTTDPSNTHKMSSTNHAGRKTHTVLLQMKI